MSKARELAELIGNAGGTSEQVLSGRRNLIINGAMQVAQRSTGAISVSDGTNETYAGVDRWYANFGTAQGGSITHQQKAINANGIKNALRIDCTGTATPAGSQNFSINTKLEIQDVSPFLYGGSEATLSFMVKTNKGGTYAANMFVDASTDIDIAKSFALAGNETWEKVTLTFPANTLSMTSPNSLIVGIYLSSGPDRIDANLSSWVTYDGDVIPEAIVNFFDSTSNYFELANVQLELGSVATPFEHRSYGEELALCQRYYWRTDANTGIIANGTANSAGNAYCNFLNMPEMRVAPAVGLKGSIANFDYVKYGVAWYPLTNWSVHHATSKNVNISVSSGTALTSGMGTDIRVSGDGVSDFFYCDAEL